MEVISKEYGCENKCACCIQVGRVRAASFISDSDRGLITIFHMTSVVQPKRQRLMGAKWSQKEPSG